ncbi:Na+/H+-dicarboxylate symporter [Maledivibacter halophilus]|uniref:Na+/H+-dicarboxylate symporter n=2 Tax=Maledivibacter halophilus TaxID=36842 RepID=A0A1T5IND5_9FIRM|nr:Na+/H+-dicarboxylate symporter [Maledivibacter halophilus]
MKKMQLSTKVFIGFALGILLGLIFKEKILIIKPLGDLFLRLIKMIVVPLVFFSIISGITSMGDIQKLKKVGTKTLLYYIVTTGIAGIIGIIVARTLKPGTGFVLDQVAKGSVEMKAIPKFSEVILNMVPINPFEALVKGDLMQVIIFSIFLGIGITLAGKKAEKFKNIFDAGSQTMYKVTNIVMEFSPIGVTALIASSVGEYGLKIFGPLGKFIIADYIAMITVILVLYSLMLKFIAKVSIKDFYRIMPKIWAVTASTTSSSGTLPVTIKVAEEDFGVKEELASFTLPLGATMNMNGAVGYLAVATIFVAQIYGIDMPIAQQAMLILMTTMIAVGAPGIPGGGIVLTVMLLGTMGLPADIMGLIAGIYRIIDMGHTSLNVTGDVVSTLCIARSENMFK